MLGRAAPYVAASGNEAAKTAGRILSMAPNMLLGMAFADGDDGAIVTGLHQIANI